MVRRKAGALLTSELAILRALDAEPRHAYGLAQDLGVVRSTVGAMLRRLEPMGLTRAVTEPGGMRDGRYRPARRIHRLTAKGRQALRDAVSRQPLADRRLR